METTREVAGQIVDTITGESYELAREGALEPEVDPIVSSWLEARDRSQKMLDEFSSWLETATRKEIIAAMVDCKVNQEFANAVFRKLKNRLLSEMETARAQKWLEGAFELSVAKGSNTYGYNKELIPALREAVRAEQGEAGLAIFDKACVPDWKTNKVYLNKMEKFGGRTGAIIEAMVTLEKEGENSLTIIGPCGIKL